MTLTNRHSLILNWDEKESKIASRLVLWGETQWCKLGSPGYCFWQCFICTLLIKGSGDQHTCSQNWTEGEGTLWYGLGVHSEWLMGSLELEWPFRIGPGCPDMFSLRVFSHWLWTAPGKCLNLSKLLLWDWSDPSKGYRWRLYADSMPSSQDNGPFPWAQTTWHSIHHIDLGICQMELTYLGWQV